MSNNVSEDSLFELRIAWIKSISRIWSAKEENPQSYLIEDDFCRDLVKQNYNDYTDTTYGAMSVLNEYKLFNNPWSIELQIRESSEAPYWNPGTGEYEVANPQKIEQVLIYIPNAPEKNRTEAAADFYACAPSIFGGFETPIFEDGKQSEVQAMSGGSGGTDSRFNVGDDTGSLYEFGAVLMDAVSLVWANEQFKELLVTKNPINSVTGNIQVEEIGKAQAALKENFDFDFPWNFDLIIAIDEGAKYIKDDNNYGTGHRWTASKRSRLVLVVPESPQVIDQYGPVALASYNAGGSKYPFSCG